MAIRAKGNTSLTQVQSYGNNRYSFKIEFDHYDSTKNYCGLDKLCLNNIIQDNTCMKDYLTYQMMGYFGVDAPLCSYAYITVNGEDWGLYLAVESIEEAFLQRNYGSSYGELYKPDSSDMGGGRGNGEKFNMGSGMGSNDVSLIYTDDEYDSYSNIFDNAKTDISDSDKERLIASLKKLNEKEAIGSVVDIDEVIRHFVVHNFVLNFDSYTGSMIHNYYLYEENGQFSMIPWDYNLAFGGFQSASDASSLVNYPIDTPVSGGTIESRPMLSWIFASEEYTEQYHQYFSEFISRYFDSGYFEQMIDSVRERIAPYVEKDPTKFCTYEEFEEGADTLKEFCMLRAESVNGQLNGTIASTSDGQAQDSSSFVDAGNLEISAMGTMENSMGHGMGNGMEQDSGSEHSMEMPEKPGGQDSNGEMPEKPGGQDFNGEMPEKLGGQDSNSEMPEKSGDQDFNGETTEKPDGMKSGFSNEAFQMIDNREGDGRETENGSDTWMLLGASVGILFIGLAVAFTFKRR